jgi:sn-glycerol 3-phosphate transport system permease protein
MEQARRVVFGDGYFPFLSPSFFFVDFEHLYAFLETFGLIDILNTGGPGRATDLLINRLYLDGFRSTAYWIGRC